MSKRVLIADDVPELRKLLTRIVDSEDDFCVVGVAEDGEVAFHKAIELRPDVVLLDLNMPVKGGLDVLPDIRQSLPDAVIVVFSGIDSPTLAAKALALGADSYIEKGRAGDEMMAIVRSLIGSL